MTQRAFNSYMVQIGMGTHPKFARLTDGEFRAHVVGVLAVAAMSPVRGSLLVGEIPAEPVDVAATAGVSEKVARSAMEKLQAVGVLEQDEEHGCLRVHDWGDINPAPRNDPSNAERQRRHRERNALRNGKVTQSVTAPVTASNTDEEEVEGELPPNGGSARKRARQQVDQSKRPEDFPPDLVPVGAEVLTILRRTWNVRGGLEPQPRGVGLAIMRNLRADHVRVARELEHWLTAGKGQRSKCGDIAHRFGDWVADAPARDARGATVHPIRGRETASDWLREDFIDGVPIADAEVVGDEGDAA